MISPEFLRRYPLFGPLSPDQLKAVSTITEVVSFAKNTTIFGEAQPAEYFYLLMEGEIDSLAMRELIGAKCEMWDTDLWVR